MPQKTVSKSKGQSQSPTKLQFKHLISEEYTNLLGLVRTGHSELHQWVIRMQTGYAFKPLSVSRRAPGGVLIATWHKDC